MKKSVVYEAIEAYRVYLEMGTTPFEKTDHDTICRCKDYLEKGGEETNNWLLSNAVILKALSYYHAQLDEIFENAQRTNDSELLIDLRAKRKAVLNLRMRFNKLNS